MKTDMLLQKDVHDELKWCPNINAAHIGVAAENGVVTLTGQVAHYAQRTNAEEATKAVYGVKAIANDIVVELAGSSKRTDQDIAEAVLNAFKWNSEVPADRVTVVVKNGWVTMDGNVDWQFEKDAASRSAHYLMGVHGVTNSIHIKPSTKWIDVTNKIEDAFRRNADLEARRIQVHTHQGKVTLTGSVSSFSDRNGAVAAAWSAPGVTQVVNELVVSS